MHSFKATVRLTALAFALAVVILPGARQPAQAAIDSGTDSSPDAVAQAAASAPVPAFAPNSASAPVSFNAAADFSPTNNPTGAWSYGQSVSRGAAFNLFWHTYTLFGLDGWDSGSNPSGVLHNGTASPVTFWTLTVPAGGLLMHPGPSGENAVVRWTAPAAGTYQIKGGFTGIDFVYPTTTDVAILDGSSEVFSGFINSYNVPLAFSVTRSVAAGETIDFTVGYGPDGNFGGDSTSLDATISAVGDLPPAWRFPWARLASWTLNGGPHDWGAKPGIPPALNPPHIPLTSASGSGLDFGPPADDRVYAMAEGDVYFVGPESYGDCGSYANVVKIRHANGWETWYLHLAAFGDFPLIGTPANPNPDNPDGNLVNPIHVLQGHLLGRAGASGACQKHLHVELMQDATHHKSWDKQVIDGWTVHMDCGTPSVAGCDDLNFDGYMHHNVPTPPPPDRLPWMKVGDSTNPTDNIPVPGGSLTALALAGTNTLHVPDISPYPLGAVVSINAGATNQEYKRFIAIGSLVLDSPLQFDHAIGEPVGIVSNVAVGGIAEEPDVTALPSRTSTASAGNRMAHAAGGAAAAALAIVAAGGWAMRRRRSE